MALVRRMIATSHGGSTKCTLLEALTSSFRGQLLRLRKECRSQYEHELGFNEIMLGYEGAFQKAGMREEYLQP